MRGAAPRQGPLERCFDLLQDANQVYIPAEEAIGEYNGADKSTMTEKTEMNHSRKC